MADILQQKLDVKVEFALGQEEMRIDMEGVEGNYYANLDEIILNTKIIDLRDLEIKKNNVKMDFQAPIICNNDNITPSKSMMVGVKFRGVDEEAFVEKIEQTAKNFGPEWEKAVIRRKEQIKERYYSNK